MTVLASKRTGDPSHTPLLLLHALPLDQSMWDPVRERLGDVDVLTVDAPGCGGSPSGGEVARRYGYDEPTVDAYVAAIAATLRELGVERVALAGLSMGGSTAAAFALANPGMVAGLALMDTNIEADGPERRDGRRRAIDLCAEGRGYEAVAGWTTSLVSPAAPRGLREDLDARFRLLPSESLAWLQTMLMNRGDARGALAAVDGPILLLRGLDDPTCTLEMLESWRELAPRARIVQIARAGHFAADEQPREVARALEDFYAEALANPGAEAGPA